MDEIFSNAAAGLTQHSMLGKPGTIPGIRELIPHESYPMPYQIDGKTVWKNSSPAIFATEHISGTEDHFPGAGKMVSGNDHG